MSAGPWKPNRSERIADIARRASERTQDPAARAAFRIIEDHATTFGRELRLESQERKRRLRRLDDVLYGEEGLDKRESRPSGNRAA